MAQNDLLESEPLLSLHLQQELFPKPNYFKRFFGGVLVGIGSIGCIITSPFLLLGGGIGYLTGILTHNDPNKTGLQGAKIGSLGSLPLVRYGLDLINEPVASKVIRPIELKPEQLEEQIPAKVSNPLLRLTQGVRIEEESNAEIHLTTETSPTIVNAPPPEKALVIVKDALPEPEPVIVKDALPEPEPVIVKDALSEPEPVIVKDALSEPEPVIVKDALPEPKPAIVKVSPPETAPITKLLTYKDTLFDNPNYVSKSSFKSIDPVNFNNHDETKAFIEQVHQLVIRLETKVNLARDDSKVTRVKGQFIETLIVITKNSYSTDCDFWGRLDMMSQQDVVTFVSQLSSSKGNKRYGLSELDYIWRRFTRIEFEPSILELRKKNLEFILKALSEVQLKDVFLSPEFLNILKQGVFLEVAANAFNSHQIVLFASMREHEAILITMIRKLKHDDYLLGKLVALMPTANMNLKDVIIDQLAHLPFHASLNIELTRLADYYIQNNTRAVQFEARSLTMTVGA